MVILLTGGAGFIGSAVVRQLIRETGRRGRQRRQADLRRQPRLAGRGPTTTPATTSSGSTSATPRRSRRVFEEHRPDAVMHLAAESHVDRSIDGPGEFIRTNVVGHLRPAPGRPRPTGAGSEERPASRFRFLHVSTDEVYGSLGADGYFTEETPYDPSRPTRRARRPPTTSSAPGTTPTACRPWSPTARTTTARTSSPRS